MTADDDASPAQRWVVVATFNATGARAPHMTEQLAEYRALGFDVLVVDASPEIGAERRADWSRLATRWIQRPNVGYDFGSWKAGCDLIVGALSATADRLALILTNDSCFGPYVPIGDVLARFDVRPSPSGTVFGITDSSETGVHHLQSYWLYFPPGSSAVAIDFLGRMAMATDRESAINLGELALSRHLRERGCTLVAHVELNALMSRCAVRFYGRWLSLLEFLVRRMLKRYRYTRRGDGACIKFLLARPGALDFVNPTLDFGRFLFRTASSPFVKIMLLRDNPTGDAMLPAHTDVRAMTNAQAAALMSGSRPIVGH